MPTYEYTCASCGHTFEAFQNITENPLSQCPSCKKDDLHRGVGGGQGLLLKKKSKKSASVGSSCCPCGKSKCG